MPEKLQPPPNYIRIASNLDGIEIFAPAPQLTEAGEVVVEFKCPQCGGTTAFNVKAGGVACPHCGYMEAPAHAVVGTKANEQEFTVETLQIAAQGWGLERKNLECQQCGANTSVPPDSLTHTCPFCGSNKVIQRVDTQNVLPPRYLVPFKIDGEKCRTIFSTWVSSSWMTPRDLQASGNRIELTGMYLPYWTFDARTTADWKAEVGHSRQERYFEDGEWKERTVIDWRWEDGRVVLDHDDLLVEGTGRLSRKLLGQIQPFDMQQLAAYEPGFLAGLQALSYDVLLEKAWETARQSMREKTRLACEQQASTERVRNFHMNVDFSDESWRYILLPIYLTSYLYAGQIYHVMLNGQTGAIAGQRPVDWGRVWMAVIALLTPGLLVGLLGVLTLVIGGIGSIIGLVGFVLLLVGIGISAYILVNAAGMDDL